MFRSLSCTCKRFTFVAAFELVHKVRLLQKRLIASSEEAIKRESALVESQRQVEELKAVLARQPGPELAEKLHATQVALREKNLKVKVRFRDALCSQVSYIVCFGINLAQRLLHKRLISSIEEVSALVDNQLQVDELKTVSRHMKVELKGKMENNIFLRTTPSYFSLFQFPLLFPFPSGGK